ncbi:hypothetical protein D1831_11515 [Lactiplantibacillus garii]|uniref:Permease n=1 Tax=Lactiplantibacillus garii TaxID=2306423 RepID=A0A3R8KK84_9LACO|nr:AEC family transporter [Lactiplantibacillus garii]RRK09677.1 hypothetical protein D1831_11515 [Lactiplantibacillus garii]
MMTTFIGALLPIIFTILLGYIAGKSKAIEPKTAGVLNKIVMNYALPLSLFFSSNQMPKQLIFNNWKIASWQLFSMLAWWLITYYVSRLMLKSSQTLAAIRAFAISTPAVLFVGPALFPVLFPQTATIIVSIGSITMGIQLCLTLFALSIATSNQAVQEHASIKQILITAFKKPVILATILGFVTAFLGLKLPVILTATFMQLGKTAAGLGLFSIGLILYAFKPSFSRLVWGDVIAKELLVPLSTMSLMLLMHEPTELINEIILTLMISQMVFPTILAQQYGEGEREMVSSIFLTTLFSFVVMAGFMFIRQIG